jgi:hypothetical protein
LRKAGSAAFLKEITEIPCSIIQELHVYGTSVAVSGSPGKSEKYDSSVLFAVYIFLGYGYFQVLSASQSIFQKSQKLSKISDFFKVSFMCQKVSILSESFSFCRKVLKSAACAA